MGAQLSRDDWKGRIGGLSYHNQAFIGGKFARGLRGGSVWVNTHDGGDITTPFSGYKPSGNGRDKSLHAFDKFTQMKTTWIQLG